MGCGGSRPRYEAPQRIQLPDPQQLWDAAIASAQAQFPTAYGAREGALADLARGTEFYEQFQPTSLDQALANQYFENVWPETQAGIRHNLSLSGQANRAFSPSLASLTGQAYGRISTDIGQYLSDLGQQRATYSLGSRLGIDPMAMLTPHVQSGLSQSQAQAELDWQAAQAAAMADYQNQLAEARDRAGAMRTAMLVGGVGLGALTGGLMAGPAMTLASGPFAGWGSTAAGMVGGGLLGGAGGGLLGSSMYGGQSPLSFGDALSLYQMPQQMETNRAYQDYLRSAIPVNPYGGGY